MNGELVWHLLVAMCSRSTAYQILQIAAVAYTIHVFPGGRVLGCIFASIVYALWYYFTAAAATRIYMTGNDTEQRVLRRMPCLRGRGYYPTPYLVNPHVQTVFAAVGRPLPKVQFFRQLNHDVYEDGEVCIVDWAFASEEAHVFWEQRNRTAGRASAAPLSSTRHDDEKRSARRTFRDARQYNEAMRQPKQRKSEPFGEPGPHSPETMEAYLRDMRQRMHSGREPIVILFHGLTGGHEDCNVYYLAKWILQRGWHVVVPVRRGCADCPSYLSRPKHYAYGGLDDTAHVVNHICDSMPNHPVYAVGLSAGSNVMVNYMAMNGRASRIYGGVSIANGYCWERGTASIRDHHPVWDVLMTEIVNSTLYDRHRDVFDAAASPTADVTADEDLPVGSPVAAASPTVPNAARAGRKPRSMREYDELISRNLHGFDSLNEFYAEQSCVHRLHKLKHPVIFLNALDDPLASYQNIPYDQLLRNAHTLLVCTPTGGHLGWATGWWPFSRTPTWMDTFILEALDGLAVEAAHRIEHPAKILGPQPNTLRSAAAGEAGTWNSSSAAASDEDTLSPKAARNRRSR